MKTASAILILLVAANVSRADDKTIPWPKKNDSPRVSVDQKGNLVVEGDTLKSTTTLLTLENPKVPSHLYRLVGKIKYEKVEGDAYLMMWSHFAKGGGPFFSKTLDSDGKGQIAGSSDWDELTLPFYSKPDMLPNKLVVKIVMSGKGKVWITPLKLEKIEQ